jgi:hypothetical protein
VAYAAVCSYSGLARGQRASVRSATERTARLPSRQATTATSYHTRIAQGFLSAVTAATVLLAAAPVHADLNKFEAEVLHHFCSCANVLVSIETVQSNTLSLRSEINTADEVTPSLEGPGQPRIPSHRTCDHTGSIGCRRVESSAWVPHNSLGKQTSKEKTSADRYGTHLWVCVMWSGFSPAIVSGRNSRV